MPTRQAEETRGAVPLALTRLRPIFYASTSQNSIGAFVKFERHKITKEHDNDVCIFILYKVFGGNALVAAQWRRQKTKLRVLLAVTPKYNLRSVLFLRGFKPVYHKFYLSAFREHSHFKRPE